MRATARFPTPVLTESGSEGISHPHQEWRRTPSDKVVKVYKNEANRKFMIGRADGYQKDFVIQ
jgi:hypothetical protein